MNKEESLSLRPGDVVYHAAHPEIPAKIKEPDGYYGPLWVPVEFSKPVAFKNNLRDPDHFWVCRLEYLYLSQEEARTVHVPDGNA